MRAKRPLSLWRISPHTVCLFDGFSHKSEIPQHDGVLSVFSIDVNRLTRGHCESHNVNSLRASAHSMLHHWLLSLILIVSWYPRISEAFTGTASGESTKEEMTRAPTSATCCASGRRHLMEEMDDKETTTTSDVKILKAFGDELTGMSSG